MPQSIDAPTLSNRMLSLHHNFVVRLDRPVALALPAPPPILLSTRNVSNGWGQSAERYHPQHAVEIRLAR